MTEIHLEERPWILSKLGPPSRLPRFRFQDPDLLLWGHEGMGDADRERMFPNCKPFVMPYPLLESYDRSHRQGNVPVIRMENERLRCLFYPTLGGRLASLFDKQRERELLFDNPVFQPANLGIRNAWFSGGAEWNTPVYGHNAHTCSPVFVATVPTPRGPLLRIYDFNRTTETVWQVDVLLPDDGARLFVHPCVRNPSSLDVDLFWWTNVAVRVDEDLRVLAPATYGIGHTVDHHIRRIEYPRFADFDGSYPGRHPDSRSVFLKHPRAPRPYMVAIDAEGAGLGHVSTRELHGRKLFTWGRTAGARRWLDFLSLPGRGDYVEIQAGLTPTQMQTVPLAAGGSIEWTECFEPFAIDPSLGHDADYQAACRAVERRLADDVPERTLDELDAFLRAQKDAKPNEVLSRGAAWGALQEELTGHAVSPGLRFDAPAGKEERAWAELVREGRFSDATLKAEPISWQVTDAWTERLTRSSRSQGATWLHHLHLGMAHLERERFDPGRAELETSLALRPSAAAHRCLALLFERDEHPHDAAEQYRRAWPLADGDADLAVEITRFLSSSGNEQELAAFLDGLPAGVRERERIQLALAQLGLAKGDTTSVRDILKRSFVTIAEGETVLSDLWFGVHLVEAEAREGEALTPAEQMLVKRKYPVPPLLDFRVRSEVGELGSRQGE